MRGVFGISGLRNAADIDQHQMIDTATTFASHDVR
jgi:hypothetical protein